MKIYFLATQNMNGKYSAYAAEVGEKYTDEFINGIYFTGKNSGEKKDVLIIYSESVKDNTEVFLNAAKTYGKNLDISILEDNRLEDTRPKLKRGLKLNKSVSEFLNKLCLSEFKKVKSSNTKLKKLYQCLVDVISVDDKNGVVVLSADPSILKILQKDRKLSKLCYFGDEKLGKLGVSRSKEEIKAGVLYDLEIDLPKQIGYNGEVETIASRRIKEKQIATEIQKI